MKNLEELIKLIPYGKINRVSKKTLMRNLKIDELTLTRMIRDLRKEYVVLADDTNGGYYRSDDEKELMKFIREQQGKAYENNKAVILAYQELDKIRGDKCE